jgi:hypothetical protein
MRRISSALGLLVLAAATVPLLTVAAFADSCVNDPECVTTDPTGDGGFPFSAVLPIIVVLVIAVSVTGYRVSVARSMAQKAGLDPGDATRVALLDQDGVGATYLASQLRREQQPGMPSAAPVHSIADRLRELDGLREQGLVSESEYAARRTAILGEV